MRSGGAPACLAGKNHCAERAGWRPPLPASQPARLQPSGFELAELPLQLAQLLV